MMEMKNRWFTSPWVRLTTKIPFERNTYKMIEKRGGKGKRGSVSVEVYIWEGFEPCPACFRYRKATPPLFENSVIFITFCLYFGTYHFIIYFYFIQNFLTNHATPVRGVRRVTPTFRLGAVSSRQERMARCGQSLRRWRWGSKKAEGGGR